MREIKFRGKKVSDGEWLFVGNDENKETLEVLGDIHDNPELLKGGAE